MDDVMRLFGVFAAIGFAGGGTYAVIALTGAFARRLERRGGADTEGLQAEVAELRHRLNETEDMRSRVAELEERLDFAERMLSKVKEAERLGAGGEPR
jgi:hypothetical protein